VWAGLLRLGGALGIAWNTFVARREEAGGVLAAAGLEVLDDAPYDAFRHSVHQSIQRDILVARKLGRTAWNRRYRLNWNQLRLTKSAPAVPVKVRNTVWTPVAEPDRLVVVLVQVCQPPVEVTGTLAMIGPVVESRRYWMVPLDAPEASRVVTDAAVGVPKSTLV
jgi:hypothetical protein